MKVGKKLLLHLKQRQIDHFFANPGTEFTSIIEAYADKKLATQLPEPILVPHESVAVHMAYGAYMATGKAQAVMVHATIGAANAAAAIMNASRMNIPMLFIAGRTPITEEGHEGSRDKFIHWAQESYDQGGMLREYVKWDYELRMTDNFEEVLDRAISIMNSGPKGPVYLQLPRELLLADISDEGPSIDRSLPANIGVPNSQQLELLANKISSAKMPLVLTKTLGEDETAVKVLEDFCERFAIPVITQDAHYLNISTKHQMFCGYQRQGNPIFQQADLILNLGQDVPWFQVSDGPSADAYIAHVGVDPLFQKIPMRTHRSDLNLVGNLKETLNSLGNFLSAHVDGDKVEARRKQIINSEKSKLDESPKTQVAQALNTVWDDDCILINELSLPIAPVQMTRPGCYFRTGSASCLGWGLGAAIGVGLTQKNKTVISVVGDGAYYFANPLVTHWLANKHQLKMITIILNNAQMESITTMAKKHFPQGEISQQCDSVLTSLAPSPAFEKIADLFEGKGFVVDELSELPKVLKEALEYTRINQQEVVINVKI